MSRVLPILFNTKMVRAILDGRKTVTRRVMKPQLPDACPKCMYIHEEFLYDLIAKNVYCARCGEPLDNAGFPYKAPYHSRDILYVRETWAPLYPDKMSDDICGYMYKAETLEEYDRMYPDGKDYYWCGKWRPSIHMPKEAARIWLKVTGVRVERLQEITEEQARREGIKGYWANPHDNECPFIGAEGEPCSTKREAFSQIWNSTIKKSDIDRYGWDASPWVWVIEFDRCENPESED